MIRINPDPYNGLIKPSSIDCFQIRSLSEERIIKYLGKVTIEDIRKVQEGICKVIGLDTI
jgi:mRNA interferase MazF